jgi:exopolysaccharide production protein ExoY
MSYTLDGAGAAAWQIVGVGGQVTPVATRSADASSAARAQRVLDITGALAIGLVLLPFILLVAVAIALSSRGPIVFKQRRIGQNGLPFLCWKFRTMVTDAEERLAELLSRDPDARAEWLRDHKLRHDPRITLIGRFLRKTSLDELPQLFNVLEGSMSLVGPRPIVLSECDRYGRYFRAYCSVRPGITGLWQISGRNDVSYRRRVAYDVVYSRRRSITMDMKILMLTLPCVALQKGAY